MLSLSEFLGGGVVEVCNMLFCRAACFYVALAFCSLLQTLSFAALFGGRLIDRFLIATVELFSAVLDCLSIQFSLSGGFGRLQAYCRASSQNRGIS